MHPTRTTSDVRPRRPARLTHLAQRVAVIATLVALFAMHGLPMASASAAPSGMSATADAGPTMAEMTGATTPSGATTPGAGTSVLPAGVDRPVEVSAPVGACGAGHDGCATVRAVPAALTPPALVALLATCPVSEPRAEAGTVGPGLGQPPPDPVDLTRLGISRT